MSWLFSSPGSVFEMAIWLRRDGWRLTIKNLLLLFETLSRVLEERDDLLDAFFHTEEVIELAITLDDLVRENPAEAGVLCRVDQFRLADRDEQPLGGGCVSRSVCPADL
jgi:hypothetical protein